MLLVGLAAASLAFDTNPDSSADPDPAEGAGRDSPSQSATDPLAPTTTGQGAPAGPSSFTIAATGDLLIHEAVADAAQTSDGWDFTSMFASVAPVLSAADVAICHVETPMSPNNGFLAYYPAFIVPNQLADAIAYAGYDTCSLASNHATDGGRDGVVGTIAALDRAGVAHAGMALSAESRDEPTLLEAGEATVAHLSYTYGFNNGPLAAEDSHLSNVIDEATILTDAGRARSRGADFVVVSMHWGTNYIAEPDEMQTDLGARLLASDDVDLIIGHHAHVVQPIDAVGDKYLVYGLGNFLSNQSPETCTGCPPGTTDGVIVHFTVTLDPQDGRWSVTEVTHTPTWVDRAGYEIVDVLRDTARDPAVLAESADRTAAALAAAGITVTTR